MVSVDFPYADPDLVRGACVVARMSTKGSRTSTGRLPVRGRPIREAHHHGLDVLGDRRCSGRRSRSMGRCGHEIVDGHAERLSLGQHDRARTRRSIIGPVAAPSTRSSSTRLGATTTVANQLSERGPAPTPRGRQPVVAMAAGPADLSAGAHRGRCDAGPESDRG